MRHVVARLGALGLLAVLEVAVAWAGTQARLVGSVKDTAGKPVAGAVLIFTTDEAAGFEKRVEVKDDGTYTTLLLDATRTYKLRVEAPGFIAQEQPLKVPAGSTDNVFDFVLKTEREALRSEQDQIMQQPGYKELSTATELLKQGRKAEAEASLEAAVAILPDTARRGRAWRSWRTSGATTPRLWSGPAPASSWTRRPSPAWRWPPTRPRRWVTTRPARATSTGTGAQSGRPGGSLQPGRGPHQRERRRPGAAPAGEVPRGRPGLPEVPVRVWHAPAPQRRHGGGQGEAAAVPGGGSGR